MARLDSLLAGVEEAVGQAKREVAAAHADAQHWRQQYEREQQLRQQLEQDAQAAQAQAHEQQTAAPPAAQKQQYGSQLETSLSVGTAVGRTTAVAHAMPVSRRHTAPALRSASTTLGTPEMLGQLSNTASRLAELRKELEQDLQAGKAADGSIALSRLSSLLHACSLLHDASAAACSAAGRGASSEMGRQDSSLEGEQGQEVALHDDGAAGVGATAAAAVSVALAQSWAAAAGARPGAYRHAAAAEGAVRPGKARFKLVAAVPGNYRRHQQYVRALTAQKSGSLVTSVDSDDAPTAAAAAAAAGALQQDGGTPKAGLPESASGLLNLAEAEPNAMDDVQEATWRASGQHLKLQWLSSPSTVLVVFKPVPAVFQSAVHAVTWLARHGVTVYVEPGVHAELASAVQTYLQSSSGDGNGDGANGERSSQSLSTANGDVGNGANGGRSSPFGSAVFPQQQQQQQGEPDLARQLVTWEAPPCGCPPAVPCSIGHQLDLIITLGGDGTVLWTCGLFAAGAVPPLVPFAAGSLGFMTPFALSQMGSVLQRVTGLERGVPLMLRHRLQCRIIRGDMASSADLAGADSRACLEEFVVLNEVVIDRGMTAQLCNLQCYADQNHVTVVQGDGLIVATPTGSTAYNLAAGGSMVHPAVPCFLFTPICPHSLASRPLVFPEHVTLRVKVPVDSRSGAYCSFDGRSRQELRPGDSVLICMSQWPAPMVCNLDASHDWFLSMREGLSWNVRKQQAGKGR